MKEILTPLTDAHIRKIGADGLADGDFARQLERDRHELREALDDILLSKIEANTWAQLRAGIGTETIQGKLLLNALALLERMKP